MCTTGLWSNTYTVIDKKQQHTAEYLVIVVFRAKILHNHREEGNVNTFSCFLAKANEIVIAGI